MKEFIAWIMEHYDDVGLVLAALVGVAELVVRLTPTQKDDGAVQRIGSIVKKVLDFLKVPNNLKDKPLEPPKK